MIKAQSAILGGTVLLAASLGLLAGTSASPSAQQDDPTQFDSPSPDGVQPQTGASTAGVHVKGFTSGLPFVYSKVRTVPQGKLLEAEEKGSIGGTAGRTRGCRSAKTTPKVGQIRAQIRAHAKVSAECGPERNPVTIARTTFSYDVTREVDGVSLSLTGGLRELDVLASASNPGAKDEDGFGEEGEGKVLADFKERHTYMTEFKMTIFIAESSRVEVLAGSGSGSAFGHIRGKINVDFCDNEF